MKTTKATTIETGMEMHIVDRSGVVTEGEVVRVSKTQFKVRVGTQITKVFGITPDHHYGTENDDQSYCEKSSGRYNSGHTAYPVKAEAEAAGLKRRETLEAAQAKRKAEAETQEAAQAKRVMRTKRACLAAWGVENSDSVLKGFHESLPDGSSLFTVNIPVALERAESKGCFERLFIRVKKADARYGDEGTGYEAAMTYVNEKMGSFSSCSGVYGKNRVELLWDLIADRYMSW